MAGYIIPVSAKRTLDFTGLASGSSESIVIAEKVPVIHWHELTLLVTVFSISIAGGGVGTITIRVHPESVARDDPGLDFVDPRTNGASVVLDSNTPNPAFLSSTIPTLHTAGPPIPIAGDLVRVIALGTRLALGALTATLGVEISAKDA